MTALLPAATRAEDLSVATVRHGSTVVVVVRGDIDLATAPLLRAVLDGVYAAHPHRVEVDLSAVASFDSHALTTLIAARRRLAARGATLVLRAPSRPVMRVLSASGLERAFEVRPGAADRQVAVS